MTNSPEADDLVDFRARVAQNTFLSVLDALKTGRVGFGAELQGYVGEAAVSEVLKRLPDDWRIVSDLEIGGENVDHLAIGPAGAFSIEVKNYSGKVIATPNGLWNKGERHDKIVRQAWRQSHKLHRLLGVQVEPILVFLCDDLQGGRVGRLKVMRPYAVVDYLQRLPKLWEPENCLEVVQKAKKLVR